MKNRPRKAFPFVPEGKMGQYCSVYPHIITVIFTYFKLRDLVSLPLGGWYQQMGNTFSLLVTCLHLASFHSLVCVECGVCVFVQTCSVSGKRDLREWAGMCCWGS